jgi:O-antigen/teichoic acid export membrane protein
VTRLLAQGLGPEEFGAYSLTRRIVTTILPFSTLAMGIRTYFEPLAELFDLSA